MTSNDLKQKVSNALLTVFPSYVRGCYSPMQRGISYASLPPYIGVNVLPNTLLIPI